MTPLNIIRLSFPAFLQAKVDQGGISKIQIVNIQANPEMMSAIGHEGLQEHIESHGIIMAGIRSYARVTPLSSEVLADLIEVLEELELSEDQGAVGGAPLLLPRIPILPRPAGERPELPPRPIRGANASPSGSNDEDFGRIRESENLAPQRRIVDHLQERLNDYGKELRSYKNELNDLAENNESANKTKMKLLRDKVKDLKARVQKSGLEGRQILLGDIKILLDCQKRIMAGNQPDLMSKVTSAFSKRDKPVVAAKPTSYTAGIGEGASGMSPPQAQAGFAAAPHRGGPGTPRAIPPPLSTPAAKVPECPVPPRLSDARSRTGAASAHLGDTVSIRRNLQVNMQSILEAQSAKDLGWLVNPADPTLGLRGGLSGLIWDVMGDANEQAVILGELKGLYSEDVKTTDLAFSLPGNFDANGFQLIAHCVGPDNRKIKDLSKALPLLEQTYINLFDEALREGCPSLAVPFISSGIYGIPLEDAVFAALKIASRLKYVSLKIDFYYKGSEDEEDTVRQHAAAFS